MKKIFNSLMAMAIAACTFTACEDVPEPYVIPGTGGNGGGQTTGSLPYTSNNLKDGWTLNSVTEEQPWSQGNTYTQATGYQDWDGSGSKSNRAVEGWLVSPKLSTVGAENVKISFDQTIRYANNVSTWANNHKVYASNNYDGSDFAAATWTELDYVPVASPYSDWTLYTSGEIQLPAEMANQENVYVAFWFQAPATGSTTWELENFRIEEGLAAETPSTPETPEGVGSEDEPLTVAEAIAKAAGNNAWVKGYIVGYVSGQALDEGATFAATGSEVSATNILIAASPDETTVANCMPVQLPTGAIRSGLNLADNPGNYKQEVLLYGDIETYFRVPGIKSTSYAKIGDKEVGTKPGNTDTPDTPATGEESGNGSKETPFNPLAAINYTKALGAGVESTAEVYVKGKISSIKYEYSSQYGTATYNISEDGTATNEFTVYSSLYFNKQSWKDGDMQIKLGDEVVVCGKVIYYQGTTPEFSSKNNWLVSLNGATEGGDNTETPDTPAPESNVTKAVEGAVLTLTNTTVTASTNTVTVDLSEQGWANTADATTITLSDGTTIEFAKNGGSNVPKYYDGSKGVRLYAKNSISITGASKAIATVVLSCDAMSGTNYVGNEQLYGIASDNALTIVNDWTSTSGGTQLRVQTIAITYAE